VQQTLKDFLKPERFKELADIRNIGFYVFAVVVLAITWSGIKTVQNNYELQKQISVIKQQNEVLQLTNQTTDLRSRYYETDEYLELAARQNLGLAAPGETVLLVPKATAMKYVDPSLVYDSLSSPAHGIKPKSKFAANFQDWRDFLLGRKLFEN
jgi:cell division protein FtsB